MNASQAPRRRGRNQSQAPLLDRVDGDLQEPVERQVYRNIRQGLMSGLIAPGSTLSSRSLAQQMGVSAQPVRDALKRLEADGILHGRPQSGFYLRDLSQSEYAEITEIRQRLEGLAGRHAAQSMPKRMCSKLRRLNEEMGRLTSPQEYLAANFRIHFAIYTHAGRRELLAIIQNLWMRVGPILHYHTHDFSRHNVLDIHETIIEALERRDADAAEQAISTDLSSAAKIIIPSLPDRPPAPGSESLQLWP